MQEEPTEVWVGYFYAAFAERGPRFIVVMRRLAEGRHQAFKVVCIFAADMLGNDCRAARPPIER